MNERIRELAEQAGMLYTLDSKPTHIDENGTHTFQEINVYKNFDPEKFAELIIKECCDVLQTETISHDGYGYNQGFLHQKIKEYFGVEE